MLRTFGNATSINLTATHAKYCANLSGSDRQARRQESEDTSTTVVTNTELSARALSQEKTNT